MSDDIHIDATGLLCPLPVLRLRKRIKPLAPGSMVTIETDDPAAIIDIPHFCLEAGHALQTSEEDGPVTRWTIRRGA